MKPTPPILNGAPLIGHFLEFRNNRNALFQRGYKSLGPIFTLKLGTQPAAVLIGPEYQKVFFLETDKKLSMHKTYRFLRAMFGEVAFTAPPEVYFEQRHILHSPFKRDKMIKYVEVMQLEVQQWLDSLGEAGEIEITNELNTLVQHVAGHALLGEDFRQRMGREFWDLYQDLSQGLDPVLPPNLPLPKFRRRDRAKAQLRQMLQPLVEERRSHPEGYHDFLQDLVIAQYKDGRMVEDETIISMLLGLIFAGHETTSGQAAWTIIQLLQNPAYLEHIRNEIDQHLPLKTPITSEQIRDLKYLEWAVRETERMRPSTDILLRYTEEEVEVGDYAIPPGWIVMVSPAVAQRLPEWFAEPDRYDPMRYAPGREEDRQHRFALITFGGGTHKCAGMNFAYNEMTIITALLFQQFDLELVTPDPQVEYGMGASRPTQTVIRYHRKPNSRNSSLVAWRHLLNLL